MSDEQPIIKKIKKVHGHGHHGGAWKVAYADFVTAMMAFFLLMWLLNATSEEQKRGITNYFAPTGTAVGGSGSGGILGGLSAFISGAMESMTNPPPSVGPLMGTTSTPDSEIPFDEVPEQSNEDLSHMAKGKKTYFDEDAENIDDETLVFPSDQLEEADVDEPSSHTVQQTNEKITGAGTGSEHVSISKEEKAKLDNLQQKEQVEKAMQKKEEALFARTANKIKQAIQGSPDLKGFEKNLLIEQTPEGLRIQIIDQDKFAMFPLASANMYSHAKKLFAKVVDIIKQLPNSIAIAGHTDANPYSKQSAYTNWELSSDRANAIRRVLIEAGLPASRIATITGKASSEPLNKQDPYSPRNRRISITLIRQAPIVQPTIAAKTLGETK